MDSVGLLLAAGAGRRMGPPKAIVDTWLVDAVNTLREGGCPRVTGGARSGGRQGATAAGGL